MEVHRDLTLYGRLLRLARPCWPHIAGLFLLGLLSTPVALLTPLPLKIAVDSVIGSRPLPGFLDTLWPATLRSGTTLLTLSVGLLLAVTLLGQLQELALTLLRTYAGDRLVLTLRAELFRNAQRLSLAYHDAKGTTDSAYRVQHDASAIQGIAVDGVIPFVTAGFALAGMIYVIARIDWQLALVALAISPVLFVISRAYRQQVRQEWREAKKLESSALSVVQEALSAIRVVKAFGQEDHERERFAHQSQEGMQAHLRVSLVEGSFNLLVGLATAAGTAAFLFVGVSHVLSGALTLGDMLLVTGYLSQLYAPLRTISKNSVALQASLASAERAFALLDEAPDVVERPGARALGRACGAVAFRNVSFAYGDGRPALHDVSFEVGAGARVGISGPTGAGKTTLVNLVTRFYDPTAGQILLDGLDLREYRLADLRAQFALVLQEPVLFSTSVAENIAYARPGASWGEIVAAARAANAHEFITRLPQGYETPVGERGMQLSGGERQRISLARAFLKNAPILILDEPTSAVDVQTEAAIMEAVEHLMRGRTTFLITHRQDTLKSCDVLLDIEHGRLARVTATRRTDALADRGRKDSRHDRAA
ncbi:MAG: ABC transporter ATP-binding protein [Chloroflexi bacterium]|nr:ABC transporter ATP-binding protein [Chloroflexota bacterium]